MIWRDKIERGRKEREREGINKIIDLAFVWYNLKHMVINHKLYTCQISRVHVSFVSNS